MKLKDLLHSDNGVCVLGAVPGGFRILRIHSLVLSWLLAPVALLLFSVVSHAEQTGFDTNAMREPVGGRRLKNWPKASEAERVEAYAVTGNVNAGLGSYVLFILCYLW